MHVGIDLLFLVPGETGGRETYARELLTALRRVRPDLRLTAFLNRETAAAGSGFWSEQVNCAVVLPHVSARSRARWAAGELVSVSRAAAHASVDVLHGAGNFGSLHGPFARVLTLHDLLWRELPELMAPPLRWATEALVVPAARRATRVVTGSEASRQAIVAQLGVPAERVVTTPYGLGSLPEPGDAARGRAGLDLDRRPLALAVATDLPHKNLALLLDALAGMPAPERPMLAFVGHGTDCGALRARARELGLEHDVRLLGGISSARLEDLYAAAALLVTPTRYEGFGLPVLEAMARGVPVACSDIPVLREVAGDEAAVWLDPGDAGTIAAAMRALLAGGADVERRRAAGRERAARFTWDATAQATAEVYEAAAAAVGGAAGRASVPHS
ncbi:MAG TPA: glycosyltransferase family 1 protein [Conexibacter sp.]|nr:glycosyltransferase family 1 protein [Conexibacter sp.]